MLSPLGPRVIDYGNPVSDHPLNTGLVSWWLGLPNNSGGPNWFDVRRANPAPLTNGPAWVADPNGFGGLSLNSSSATYLSRPTVVTDPPFTFSAWVKVPSASTSGERGIVALDNGTSGQIQALQLNGNGANSGQVVAYTSASGAEVGAISTTAVTPDVWQHACGVWASASDRRAFLNGGNKGTDLNTRTPSSETTLQIGRRFDSRYFTGLVSDVRVYNRVLSDAEVFGLYTQGLRGNPDTLRRYTPAVWFLPQPASGGGPTTVVPDPATATATATAPTTQLLLTVVPPAVAATATATDTLLSFGGVTYTPTASLATATATAPTPTFGTATFAPGTADASATVVDVLTSYDQTAVPGSADATATAADVLVVYGQLVVVPGSAGATATATAPTPTFGTATITVPTATATATAADVLVADEYTAVPTSAPASATATPPSVSLLYTAVPDPVLATAAGVGVSVVVGPLSVVPAAASGTGTATPPALTFGGASFTPGSASGQASAVDVTAASPTTAVPATTEATATAADAGVLQTYVAVPAPAQATGTATTPTVTHGGLTVTPGVATGVGACVNVRAIHGGSGGGGARLLLVGAS